MLLVAALCWGFALNAGAADESGQGPNPALASEASPPGAEPPTDAPDSESGTPEAPPSPDPSQLTFAINEFQLEGNTIIPPDQVEAILDRYIGPERRVKDVDDARAALETLYRETGYPTVLVVVPEQTVEDGIVKLTVIESTLGELSVTGNRHISTQRLLDKLPALRPGALLHEPTVLEQLDAVNATPDRQVAPVLTVGQEPGTVNLELKVRDRLPLHGSVEWNNRGTPSTPEQRLSASLRYTDLFAREHTLALQTVQSPQDWGAVQVYSASYVIPLEAGRTFSAYAALSNSDSSLDVSSVQTGGGATITGNATIGGLRYTLTLEDTHQLSVGLDYKHLRESETPIPDHPGTPEVDPVTVVTASAISYAPVSLVYLGSAPDDGGLTRWSLSITEHISELIPGGGKREFGGIPETLEDLDFTNNVPGNRLGATGTFVVLKAHGSRVQSLDQGFSLSVTLDGQVASEPLIPAEQMFAGGIESVRAYLENEALGDHGIRGSVELSTPSWSVQGPGSWLRGALQGSVFVDGAALQVKDPLPSEANDYRLMGMGFGVRARLTQGVQAKLDQAWALADGPITRQGDTRGHVSVVVEF